MRSARKAAAAAARAERRARRDLRRAVRDRKRTEKAEVRRFTARRRRTRIAFAVTAGIVAILAGVVSLGAFSPLFALREVRVEGAALVPAADIQGVVDDQLGTPLPLLDFDRIETGLSGFPLIQSYSTESLPPGTLVVRVVERTPVAVLARGGAFDLVDSAGVVVSTQPERIAGYPLIDLPTGEVASVDFTAAAEVLVALPGDLRAQVDSIRASTVDDVTLTLAGGQRVVWGDPSDSARKAQHLARLLAQNPGNITEYDVSSPGVGILR
ncbi:MAG: cell division protein FtsQ/DivIB [Naasia sp.]